MTCWEFADKHTLASLALACITGFTLYQSVGFLAKAIALVALAIMGAHADVGSVS